MSDGTKERDPAAEAPASAPARLRRPRPAGLLLAAIPLVGVVELGLHLKQTTSDVVPDRDWVAAREAVQAELRPDDLVVFAPFWSDPLGRRFFGDGLATLAREARPDATRFSRAFEVSIRGAHAEELAGWKRVSEKSAGRVTVGLYENPTPATVLSDLVELARPGALTVSRVDAGETPCTFQRGASQGGSTVVPQGALVPAERWTCGSGHVGVGVLHALDHRPHRCIFVTPMGGATVRLTFSGVTFGGSVHGHSGIQWVSERTPSPERVNVAFSAFERPIGQHSHKVGVGWVGYELPTPELAGKKGDLVVEVTGAQSQRHFCFEADTR